MIFGGTLSDRKGVNLPDTVIPIAALTEKDRADLEAAADIGVDWIALSFVQRPEDVAEARQLVRGRAGVMAKIEKPSALNSLDGILEIADGIMVARGDLGVELPLETVPGRQKQLTRAARRAGKPVVVATQMLESMITEPVPTRAEVSDVATAVYEGADAIMLSAESATGKWPDKAVATMDRIAQTVERDTLLSRHSSPPSATSRSRPAPMPFRRRRAPFPKPSNLAAIVCYTGSGSTGLRVARERPETPVIALTPIAATARRLALAWGLHCVLTADAQDLDDMVARACRIAYSEGFAAARPAHHHHRRRAAGNPGRHQHAAHRLCRQGRRRGELNRPLELFEFLHRILGRIHGGIDRQRIAEGRERRPITCPPCGRSCRGPESAPKWRGSRSSTLSMSASEFVDPPHHEIQRGALVPGLGELRVNRDQAVENGQRGFEGGLVHGLGCLLEQQFGGGRIGTHPQLPDRLLGDPRLFVASHLAQPGKQAVERLGADLGRASANHLAPRFARLLGLGRQQCQWHKQEGDQCGAHRRIIYGSKAAIKRPPHQLSPGAP